LNLLGLHVGNAGEFLPQLTKDYTIPDGGNNVAGNGG